MQLRVSVCKSWLAISGKTLQKTFFRDPPAPPCISRSHTIKMEMSLVRAWNNGFEIMRILTHPVSPRASIRTGY